MVNWRFLLSISVELSRRQIEKSGVRVEAQAGDMNMRFVIISMEIYKGTVSIKEIWLEISSHSLAELPRNIQNPSSMTPVPGEFNLFYGKRGFMIQLQLLLFKY